MKIESEVQYLQAVMKSYNFIQVAKILGVHPVHSYRYASTKGIHPLVREYFNHKKQNKKISINSTKDGFVVNSVVYEPLRDYYKNLFGSGE